MTDQNLMPTDAAHLREMVEQATPEQRLALAKAGITLAVLQEKLRMGFTNEEVATVLATDEDDEVITEAYELWRQRLEQFTETLNDEGQLNDDGSFDSGDEDDEDGDGGGLDFSDPQPAAPNPAGRLGFSFSAGPLRRSRSAPGFPRSADRSEYPD